MLLIRCGKSGHIFKSELLNLKEVFYDKAKKAKLHEIIQRRGCEFDHGSGLLRGRGCSEPRSEYNYLNATVGAIYIAVFSHMSEIDPRLGFDIFPVGMFDFIYLTDRVGKINNFRMGVSASQDDMHMIGAHV